MPNCDRLVFNAYPGKPLTVCSIRDILETCWRWTRLGRRTGAYRLLKTLPFLVVSRSERGGHTRPRFVGGHSDWTEKPCAGTFAAKVSFGGVASVPFIIFRSRGQTREKLVAFDKRRTMAVMSARRRRREVVSRSSPGHRDNTGAPCDKNKNV